MERSLRTPQPKERSIINYQSKERSTIKSQSEDNPPVPWESRSLRRGPWEAPSPSANALFVLKKSDFTRLEQTAFGGTNQGHKIALRSLLVVEANCHMSHVMFTLDMLFKMTYCSSSIITFLTRISNFLMFTLNTRFEGVCCSRSVITLITRIFQFFMFLQ